jgi:small-conductance mechanosensitive channel
MVLPGFVTAAAVIIFGVVVALIVRFTVRWLKKRATCTESKLDDLIVMAIGTPVVVAIIVVSVYIALKYFADIPPEYSWIFDSKYISSIYIIIGAWIVSTFFYNFIQMYGKWIGAKTQTEIDDKLINLLLLVSKYLIWFVAFMMILSSLEIDITPILAGAGIAGLAFALAAQDILSNFFGGAIISLDKPFGLNDRIKIEEFTGEVVSVGPRSTRIKTLDNQLVTIPNSKITTSVVTNYTLPDERQKVRIPVSVAYGSDIPRVKEILVGIVNDAAEKYDFIATDPAPQVFFREFGPSSLDFQTIVWTRDYTKEWDVADAINMMIAERFRKEGIEIPFPQIDVHLRGGNRSNIS